MHYFIFNNGEKSGPFTLEQLLAVANKGEMAPDLQYWHEGMDDWKPIAPFLAAKLPPRNKTVEVVFSADLYYCPVSDERIKEKNSAPDLFARLEGSLEDDEKIEAFGVSHQVLTGHLKLVAATSSGLRVTWSKDNPGPDYRGRLDEIILYPTMKSAILVRNLGISSLCIVDNTPEGRVLQVHFAVPSSSESIMVALNKRVKSENFEKGKFEEKQGDAGQQLVGFFLLLAIGIVVWLFLK